MLSQDSSYYVYALKDSRTSPALIFYVGKGVGTRSHDHLLKPDATRKGKRIKEIVASGGQVLVSRLVDAITESQAIKLEAELIAALGTVDSGGLLTNSVLPSGLAAKVRASVTVPSGVKEKAQLGLSLLKDAVLELARANAKGISNSRRSESPRSAQRLWRRLEGLSLIQHHRRPHARGQA